MLGSGPASKSGTGSAAAILKDTPSSAHEGIGVIEGGVFALLSLLLAFSFAGGTSRLETKRQLVVQEANAIGTAYLRLDVLPVNEQPELRRYFGNTWMHGSEFTNGFPI